jgi:hypothetical protein
MAQVLVRLQVVRARAWELVPARAAPASVPESVAVSAALASVRASAQVVREQVSAPVLVWVVQVRVPE